MGERKVLNKYYPQDFNPAKIPRAQWAKKQQIKVRLMLPISIQCNTCGTYIYKGTKFNSRKEEIVGETYLGIQIFRFYFKCTNCSAELTIKTDPRNSDYAVESGAALNYEPWRATNEAVEIGKRKREAVEMGDAMKSLENRAQDSKQDMDIQASLEEMKSLKSRHAAVSIDDALATLHLTKQEKGHKEYVKRIRDSEDENEDDFNEKGKSRAGVPSMVEKPTYILSKTSIFIGGFGIQNSAFRTQHSGFRIKVRLMLPMSIQCNTCGVYIYKGTKFNCRKEEVVGETYLGIKIFRFCLKCTNCSAELTIKTDPRNSDYVVESGAALNYQPSRANDERAGVKHLLVVKRKSVDVQPAKELCIAERNKPYSATDGIEAENGLVSLCQNYANDSE